MKIGTRSVLYGAHQFILHPWLVARAWRYLYGKWPTIDQWICIACHDSFGYWGSPNMDGVEGRRHPERGAILAKKLVYWRNRLCGRTWIDSFDASIRAHALTLYHSSHYAREHAMFTSALYLPDKVSILFEKKWCYIVRTRMSGEIWEYIENSPLAKLPPELKSPGAWHNWYCRKVREKLFWMPERDWRRMKQ